MKPRRSQLTRLTALAVATLLGTGAMSLGACGADLYDSAYVTKANGWLDNFEHHPKKRTLRGKVSYYHDSLAGNTTANGEVYDPRLLTAASRTLPFGTVLRVKRLQDGRTIIVRVNDRGPFGDKRRILDLSREAASRLGMLRAGVVNVEVDVLWTP